MKFGHVYNKEKAKFFFLSKLNDFKLYVEILEYVLQCLNTCLLPPTSRGVVKEVAVPNFLALTFPILGSHFAHK